MMGIIDALAFFYIYIKLYISIIRVKSSRRVKMAGMSLVWIVFSTLIDNLKVCLGRVAVVGPKVTVYIPKETYLRFPQNLLKIPSY